MPSNQNQHRSNQYHSWRAVSSGSVPDTLPLSQWAARSQPGEPACHFGRPISHELAFSSFAAS